MLLFAMIELGVYVSVALTALAFAALMWSCRAAYLVLVWMPGLLLDTYREYKAVRRSKRGGARPASPPAQGRR